MEVVFKNKDKEDVEQVAILNIFEQRLERGEVNSTCLSGYNSIDL